MHMFGGYGMGYGGGGFGMIFMILLWAGLIALVVFIIREVIRRSSSKTNKQESPLDLAKKRYASGEISKQEFDSLKREID